MRSPSWYILSCALALVAVILPVSAEPSFQGYTGLLNTPSAYTVSPGAFNVGIFTTLQSDNNCTTVTGNLGILPGLEGGVANVTREHGPNRLMLNGKFQVRGEGTVFPAVSVGVADITDEYDFSPYLVASKAVSPVGRTFFNPAIHLGVGGGRFDGLFLGVTAGLGRQATVMAEYDSQNINVGANYSLSPEIKIYGGTFDGVSNLGFGISYSKKL
jgi:hypothetical protein